MDGPSDRAVLERSGPLDSPCRESDQRGGRSGIDPLCDTSRSRNLLQFVNDEKKFAVSLDVSHFKPEELKVELEGRDLTIEGVQEVKTDHGYMKK